MTDIFLSYTEKDREQARRVAAMLESVGWTVWWDRRIPAGETWRGVLEKALGNMRCMIVLWSARSIESEWVYEEATEGRRLGKLVPVMIEAVRPPAGFREIQAADLTNWDGSREFDGMRMLIADLENLLGKPVPAVATVAAIPDKPVAQGLPYDPADLAGGGTTKTWWQRHHLPAIAAAGVMLAAGAAFLALFAAAGRGCATGPRTRTAGTCPRAIAGGTRSPYSTALEPRTGGSDHRPSSTRATADRPQGNDTPRCETPTKDSASAGQACRNDTFGKRPMCRSSLQDPVGRVAFL